MSNEIKKNIIDNAELDRKDSKDLLKEISKYLDLTSPDPEGYSKVMLSAAKLMECRAKSNEQLLKMFEIEKKNKTAKEPTEVSEDELDSILEGESVEI